MRSRTIGLLINSFQVGGAERLRVEVLSRHLRTTPWKFVVIALGPEGPIGDELGAMGVETICLSSRMKISPLVFSDLTREVRDRSLDILHCHLPRAGVIGRLIGRYVRVPSIYTEHNVWSCYHPLTHFLNRITLSLCDQVIAVSNAVKASMHTFPGCNHTRILTIANGVDVDQIASFRRCRDQVRSELGIPDSSLVVGHVGNIRQEKGHSFLIRAAAEVCAEEQNVIFFTAGEEFGRRAVLEREAIALGLGAKFRFLGYRRNIRQLMSGFDVFVLPSVYEGLPISLLESMALGKPAVVTAVGGNADVVENGVSGILVPPSDVNALAQGILQLIRSPNLRISFGEAAERIVRARFSIERVADEYAAVYAAFLSKKH